MTSPYGNDNNNDPYGQQQPQYGQQPPQYGQQQPYGAAPQYGAPAGGVEPDNNLVWAILCTVLCCLPLGIVAIVKSTSVSKLWAAGDYAGAQQAADDAKKWSMWGAIIGVVWIVVVVIIYFVVIAAAVSTSTY